MKIGNALAIGFCLAATAVFVWQGDPGLAMAAIVLAFLCR